MIVNICGVKHQVIDADDVFNAGDMHFGQINFIEGQILVNKDLTSELRKETICHEMVHGMLVHIGYQELSQDEKLVQALGNAIMQGFYIKDLEQLLGPAG